MARHIPVGRIAVGVAVVVAAWMVVQEARPPRWRTLQAGIEFGMMRGDPFCRRGSAEIAVLRLDPAHVDLAVHHCSRQPERTPLPLLEWQRRLGAIAVFNAGQYYPDFSYMGLLVSGGEVISGRPHPRFRAALVAGPVGGGAGARVLDLETRSLAKERARWREIAQSFMLFDGQGEPRVKRTEQVARRTAVGEDRAGRLLVITSEGGYTLWEFARLLQAAPLGLTHAMSMDGGREAELCVSSRGFRYASFGRWEDGADDQVAVPLPAVIAVSPR